MRVYALVIAMLWTAAGPQASWAQTVISNVSVIPMDRDTILQNQSVLVENARIVSIQPVEVFVPPHGAVTIDGTDRYLMPGLADMHVHLYSDPDELPLYVANGVTHVRDLSGTAQYLGWRREIAQGTRVGPNLTLGSPIIDAPGPKRTFLLRLAALLAGALVGGVVFRRMWLGWRGLGVGGGVGGAVAWGVLAIIPFPDMLMGKGTKYHDYAWNALDMRRTVRKAAAQYDQVKLYERMSAKLFRHATDEARRQGLRSVVHVPLTMTLGATLAAGADELAHAYFLVQPLIANGATGQGQTQMRQRMDSLVSAVKVAGIDITSTLTPLPDLDLQFNEPEAYLARDELRFMTLAALANVELHTSTGEDTLLTYSLEPHIRWGTQIVVALVKTGVPVALGTDATPRGTVLAGFSVHDELDILIAGGLTPFEALTTATTNASGVAGNPGNWGAVRPGMRADLLLLDTNPLAEPGTLRRPAGVMVAGRWFDRAMLDSLLDSVASRRSAGSTP